LRQIGRLLGRHHATIGLELTRVPHPAGMIQRLRGLRMMWRGDAPVRGRNWCPRLRSMTGCATV
jgi:hypothetical protein